MSWSITYTTYVWRMGATNMGCKSTRSRLFDGKAAASATRARIMGSTIKRTTGTRDRRSATWKVSMVEGCNVGISNSKLSWMRRRWVVVNGRNVFTKRRRQRRATSRCITERQTKAFT